MWNRILREPLLHFLILAGLLFAGQQWLAPLDRPTIRINQAAIGAMVLQMAEVLGRPPTEAERQALIEEYIDDEVLVREAYARGLDQDSVVRRHLVQKMRYLLADDLPEPTEADLRAFLDANTERYRMPPTLTVEQVYYADPRDVPYGQLARLRRGMDITSLGDRLFMLGNTLPRYTERDLAGFLGPELATQLLGFPLGEWRGPLMSDQGAHFLRVVERHPPELPAFETLESYLATDWVLARQRELAAAEIALLRQGYDITIEAEPDPSLAASPAGDQR